MKIRSSKELKEAIQNVDRVIENESNIDPVITVDPILADAYEQNKAAEEHVEEVLTELDKKAEEVVEENPEAPLALKNEYTNQIKLDESIEDFRLNEDGRKSRIAARDENDTDLYLDYDMLEFVYELLSAGSKGITNIAPKTPLVHRKKTENSPMIELPMKKFSPNGSQVIAKEYVYLLDLAPTQSREISRVMARIPKDILAIIEKKSTNVADAYQVQEAFESLCDEIPDAVAKYGRDAIGYAFLNNIKTLSTPQLSEAGNKVVVYSDNLDDFTQAAEGLMFYGITSEAPVPKRSRTSHWDYSMVVNVPCYSDGEPMLFEDWLEETGRDIDDVMDPAVAKRFKNKYAKADKAAEQFRKIKLTDDIIDEYADRAMDIDPDDTSAMEALYAEMCQKLSENDIKCDSSIRARFSDVYALRIIGIYYTISPSV